MTLENPTLIQHYARVGDAQGLSQLLEQKEDFSDQLHEALLKAISEGHAECVRLLASHVDLTYDKCCYFRRAVTKRCVECAQAVVPTTHPHLPRGYIYVEDIMTRSVANCTDEQKAILLHLCGRVFDFKEDNSRALRCAIAYNKQYAIDALYPFSDVRAVLNWVCGGNNDTVNALRARFERDCLIKHIDVPSTSLNRKM